MRILLLGIAIVVCCFLTSQGHSFITKLGVLGQTKKTTEASIAKQEARLATLLQYKKEEGQTLVVSYQAFYNNVLAISNAVGSGVTVKVKGGDQDKDIRLAAKPSEYEGISSLELEVTLNNLNSVNAAMSTFNAFSDLAKDTPIKILGFQEEKDSVIFNVIVYGI